MEKSPTNNAVDTCLLEFCEACLELLMGQPTGGSILADVLPSFEKTIRKCAQSRGPLADDLAKWKETSQQLVRLATLHCGNETTVLVNSLERIAREATRAITALDVLGSKADVIAAEGPTEIFSLKSDSSTNRNSVDAPLREFCEAVMVLLTAGPADSSVIPQTMPTLHHLFMSCTTDVLAELRKELSNSRKTTEHLLQFADVHCRTAVSQLQHRVRQTQDSAERLINAMESLACTASGGELAVDIDSFSISGEGEAAAPVVSAADRQQAQTFFRLAMQSHQSQDLRTAETLYSAALRLDGTFHLAWQRRGCIRLLNGDFNLAVADLSRSLQLVADAVTLRWRGSALGLCGRLSEALKDYDRALQLRPDNSIVQYNRAVVLRMMERYDDAWSEFEQMLLQQEYTAGTHLNRGLICLARQQKEQAIEEFQAALVAQPGLREAVERLTQLGVTVDLEAPFRANSAPSPVLELRTRESMELAVSEPEPSKSEPSIPRNGGTRAKPTRATIAASSKSIAASRKPAQESRKAVMEDAAADLSAQDFSDEMAVSVLSEELPLSPSDDEIRMTSNDSAIESLPQNSSSFEVPLKAATAVVTDTATAIAAMIPMQLPGRLDASQPNQNSQATMEIRCQECDGLNFIRLDRLQPGKMITCRRCECHFVVPTNGSLVRIVKNRKGKWIEYRDDPFARLKDWRALSGLAAVAVLFAFLFFRPQGIDNFIPEDAGYPQELEPRAKMFTMAWLRGDLHTMLQLTDAVQSQELFLWTMDHPPPTVASPGTLERDAVLNVEIVDATHPNARVQVKIDGLRFERGRPISELAQEWKQDGDRWIFQPTLGRPNL